MGAPSPPTGYDDDGRAVVGVGDDDAPVGVWPGVGGGPGLGVGGGFGLVVGTNGPGCRARKPLTSVG